MMNLLCRLLLASSLCLSLPLFGQETRGVIFGRVLDPAMRRCPAPP